MKIIHPDFNNPVSLSQLEGYREEGVFVVIPSEKKHRLNQFLECFELYREDRNERIKDAKLYDRLPFSISDESWKSKRKDIEIIKKVINKRQHLKIADVGSWNGWLANYLSLHGHEVVATDIFMDQFDGLKATNHYTSNFTALQLLPNELWRIQDTFDIIIFNRNWAYIEDKESVFESAKKLLSKNGAILFTGLTIYKDSSKFEQQLGEVKLDFEKKYGVPLFFFDTKGYLNQSDYAFFNNHFKVYPYSVVKQFIKKIIQANRSFKYAIYNLK